jgi:hypothetical protein
MINFELYVVVSTSFSFGVMDRTRHLDAMPYEL